MTSQMPLLHATMFPVGPAHLEIPSRHETLLSLLFPAGHLPGNIKFKISVHIKYNGHSVWSFEKKDLYW